MDSHISRFSHHPPTALYRRLRALTGVEGVGTSAEKCQGAEKAGELQCPG